MEVEGNNIIAKAISEIKPFNFEERQGEEERSREEQDRLERERIAALELSRLRINEREAERLRQEEAERLRQQEAERLRQQRERINLPLMNAEEALKNKISNFLANDKKNLIDEVEELKNQLKKKYLSQKAIEEEKKRIAAKIFYFPTVALVNAIKANGKDHEVVLFKSIALKHGDLQEYKVNHKQEIDHITENVVNWGNLYFDIKKLESAATRKTGGMMSKTYELDPYELEVSLVPKQSNSITVKYKGNVTSQQEFKETHLEKMAEERLREVATRMYYDYVKKDEFL